MLGVATKVATDVCSLSWDQCRVSARLRFILLCHGDGTGG
jgi:hypothetical protein